MTIDNLRHFVAVVENDGVNRAAERIAISSSSLTRSIQWIEDQLGKKVFDRVGRKVVLNSVGQDLYARAKPLLRDFQAITRDPVSLRLAGHYQIGASHFLCRHLVAKKLPGILRAHPNVSFNLFSLDTSVLVKKLHRGDLDLGLGFSPRVPESLHSTEISAGTLRLCAGKRHALAKLPFSKLRQRLSAMPAIMHRPTDSVERCDNHPMFRAYGIRPKIRLYWDSDEVAVQMLATGEYWTLLPDVVIDAHPGVRVLSHPAAWHAPYKICLLRNKQRTSQELERLFQY